MRQKYELHEPTDDSLRNILKVKIHAVNDRPRHKSRTKHNQPDHQQQPQFTSSVTKSKSKFKAKKEDTSVYELFYELLKKRVYYQKEEKRRLNKIEQLQIEWKEVLDFCCLSVLFFFIFLILALFEAGETYREHLFSYHIRSHNRYAYDSVWRSLNPRLGLQCNDQRVMQL